MAEFCKQCSIELFGEDHGELANALTEKEEAEGYMALVMCEGCGPIQVNRAGECLSEDCDGAHRKHEGDCDHA